MEPETWERVRDLFHRALELPAEEREVFLTAECAAGERALRAEVLALLAAAEQAGDFLESRAADAVPEIEALRPGALVGMRIGPYRLTEELGRGGMGTVYSGVRDDASFTQQVAIKLIKRGMDTDEILRRFLVERQILATLVHPNIARLLDGGSTVDDRPYFVMERIVGRPIGEHCREHDLGLEEILRLFVDVARAVQFAHQHLVVHRDLKPANILVGDDGVPKLLDFGIAKLLAPAEVGTIDGSRPRTPDYASPEQLAGGPITTATDVYGLGLLLYELLVGTRPMIGGMGGSGAVVPPSRALRESATAQGASGRRRFARRVAGDLDTIIAKALEPLPQRRYASAADFADDVERFLAHRPVEARRPAAAYRLSSFVRRHKLASTAAAALLGLMGVASVQAIALARERAHVERERQRAEAQLRFLIDLFKVADPETSRGKTVTARQLLDTGRDLLLDKSRRAPLFPRAMEGLRQHPESQLDLLDAIGKTYLNLGLSTEAGVVLERSLTLRGTSEAREAALDRAGTSLLLAEVRREQGDFATAERLLSAALAAREKYLGIDSLPVAECLAERGWLDQLRGDLDGSEKHLMRAAEIQRRAGVEGELALAASLSGLATLEVARERPDRALAWVNEARRIHHRLLGDDHPQTATDLTNLAGLYFRQGKYAEAERSIREALALRRRLFGPHHPEVAEALVSLSAVAEKRGDLRGAELHVREALAIFRGPGLEDHPSLPAALSNLAAILATQRQYREAEPVLQEAVSVYTRQEGARSPNVATCWNNLAKARRELGDFAGAEELFRKALALWTETLGPEHPKIALARNGLAGTLQSEGRLAEAEKEYRQALALRRKVLGPDNPDVAFSLVGLGAVLVRTGRAGEAEPLLTEALALRRRTLPAGHALIGLAEGTLGDCRAAQGRPAEARALWTSSERILSAAWGADHPETRRVRGRISRF
ncbi:MAG TPA: serine/threonine-protein kinase [Thermoanaerobaculia bacterium]|jgi:serine/threonine-protein kinase|nr:serine/threonine-protein kinase [Thermoanaerobaculia bacterium]